MKGRGESLGKDKVPKKVSFQNEFDQPETQDKSQHKLDLRAANTRDAMPSSSQGAARTSDGASSRRQESSSHTLEQVLEDQSGETSAYHTRDQMPSYEIGVENMENSLPHTESGVKSSSNSFFNKEPSRRHGQGASRFHDLTSDEEAAQEGPAGYHHSASNFDKMGQYSARRGGGDHRDAEEKHTLTSDNRSQSDEDQHSIPSQRPVVAPGPQVQQQQQPQKDLFRRFSQRHDPKWAAMIALLAHGEVDEAIKTIEEHKQEQSKLSQGTKDATFSTVNLLFAYAKCYLLKADQINFNRVAEILKQISERLEGLLTKYFSLDVIKQELATETQKILNEQRQTIGATSSRSMTTKSQSNSEKMFMYKDFRWVLQSFGLMASFYNAIGMQVQCEKAYVRYIQLVEQFFNNDSLETSNAYFLVGLYYFEQNLSHKSIACFRKALAIREAKFKPMHISCSDCLMNLGILYKLRGSSTHARQNLERALRIRQEEIGVESLPAAAVHEELGKFFLEEEDFQESYINLKRCYYIRKKIYSNRRVQDVERIATLLVFLHRKIELQIVNYKTSFEKGGLKLLTQLGNELAHTITGVNAEQMGKGQDESFSFLRRVDEKDGIEEYSIAQSPYSAGSEQMGGLSSTTSKREKRRQKKLQEQAAAAQALGGFPHVSDLRMAADSQKWKEDQAEKAMRNFKARGSMVPDQNRLLNRDRRATKTNNTTDRELSSDSSIEAFVDNGVHNAFSVAEKTVKENFHPYAISLLLSLSKEQLGVLQQKQLARTQDKDPLYLSKEFMELLDLSQEQLLKDSKLWLIPRKQLIRKSPQDLLIDRKANELENGSSYPTGHYSFYSIKLNNLITPEANDKAAMRKQLKRDQDIFKFIQKAPQFIKTLQSSQSTLFRNVMNYNYTLKYFFLSVTSEQVSTINDLLKGKDLAVSETQKLTWIFSEFFNLKGNNSPRMAEAIIQDQIESRPVGDYDEFDQYYIKEHYINEICLLHGQLSSFSDQERINPKHLGMDTNFLSSELRGEEAEQMAEHFESYDDIIERKDEDWQYELELLWNKIMQIANTKILYLIYRQVKHVYDRRQKQIKHEQVRQKTVDYGHGPAMTRGMQILKTKPTRDHVVESSGDLRSDSEFNDRDSNPLDRMINPTNSAGAFQQSQVQQLQASKSRINTLKSGGSSSNHPKEYYDTFGPGDINFDEDGSSNHMLGRGSGKLKTDHNYQGAIRMQNAQGSFGKKSGGFPPKMATGPGVLQQPKRGTHFDLVQTNQSVIKHNMNNPDSFNDSGIRQTIYDLTQQKQHSSANSRKQMGRVSPTLVQKDGSDTSPFNSDSDFPTSNDRTYNERQEPTTQFRGVPNARGGQQRGHIPQISDDDSLARADLDDSDDVDGLFEHNADLQ